MTVLAVLSLLLLAVGLSETGVEHNYLTVEGLLEGTGHLVIGRDAEITVVVRNKSRENLNIHHIEGTCTGADGKRTDIKSMKVDTILAENEGSTFIYKFIPFVDPGTYEISLFVAFTPEDLQYRQNILAFKRSVVVDTEPVCYYSRELLFIYLVIALSVVGMFCGVRRILSRTTRPQPNREKKQPKVVKDLSNALESKTSVRSEWIPEEHKKFK